MNVLCFLEEAYVSKNYNVYLPAKEAMFLEVMTCNYKSVNLKNADCLLFSCH